MIRRATTDDLGAVMTLLHEFDPTTAEAGVVPLLADDTHGVIWVTDSGDGIDGYAVVTWGWSVEAGGPEALLDEIYVRDRNSGTGTALVEHVIGDCRARGITRIFLETEADNAAARRLYGRLGFAVEDSVWMVRAL